jgi:hypothetical protein
VELRYAYDGADHRVRKTAVSTAEERHSIYVFDSLELRRAAFVNGDYERTMKTEVVYLFAGGVRLARLHHMADDAPRLQSGSLHVFLELPDYLGSSSIVIDTILEGKGPSYSAVVVVAGRGTIDSGARFVVVTLSGDDMAALQETAKLVEESLQISAAPIPVR